MVLRCRPRITMLLWLLSFPLLAICQQLPLRYYKQVDGLGNLAVNALVQERSGYIWIGTENGLFRYDGARFERFELGDGVAAPNIFALHVDADGHLWAGTSNGLHQLQGQRFVLTQFQNTRLAFDKGQVFASLGSNRFLALSQDQLWLLKSTDQGATWQAHPFFSAEQLAQHPEMHSLRSIHVGPKGDLWIGCSQSLCHYDQGKLLVLGRKEGLPAERWVAMLHDRQGTLWLRGERHVFALPADANSFLDRSPAQDQQKKAGRVPLLVADASGRILSQQDSGIIRWQGNSWESFTESNGLTIGGGINSILVDRDDGVWLGSFGLGLIHWLGYPSWENWTSTQGLPSNVVWSFLRDQEGLLHVGTASGSATLQKTGRFSIFPGRYGDRSHQWDSLVQDGRGRIWASSLSGFLVRRDPGAKRDVVVAKLPMIVRLFFDRSGQLWICTRRGLYVIKHADANAVPLQVTEFTSITGSADIRFFHGCQSKSGALWFVSNKGVLRFDGGGWRKRRLSPAAPVARLESIVCSDNGDLWFGTGGGGIWRAREQDDRLEISDATPLPLLNQAVLSLLEDRRGWLWLATDTGIAVWNRAQWRFFNQESGMVWNDSNQYALYEDSDGSIWVGTSNGASHILHPESLFAPVHLEVQVASVTGDGQVLAADKPIRLPWTTGPLNFKLAVLSYQNREAVQFSYRLKGLERDWSKTAIPEVRYPALPPGRYSLQVAADNVAMQTSSPMAEIGIVILPPWWKTTTIYVACAVFLLLLLFLIERHRARSLRARQQLKAQLERERAYELEQSREEERKHLTREIHDELGQYLSALRMGVSVVGMEFGEKNPSLQGKIQRLVSLVDGTIRVVRNIVSALRPGALDMGIVSALEWLVEEFSENTGIPCTLRVCEETITLDDKRATTIFRIVQESLTNIGRHAEASQVGIRLERKDQHYLLEVCDNGKGFDPALRKKKSFGLVGIRERASMLDGHADIISVPNVGTTIKVFIPIGG
ncbi:Two component regulator propeller [Collimonas sp. OK412]|nr:Two component regulator propeller [Collimonas sp. OK412]